MKRTLGLVILLLGILAVYPFLQGFWSTGEAFKPENLIRIHILANSDSAIDQAAKLKVRDRVVTFLSPKLAYSPSPAVSRAIIWLNLPALQTVVEDEILSNHSAYGSRMQMGRYLFPDRWYDGWLVPRGEYQALRIVLGQGRGHNWWCVLYPPLCLGKEDAAQVKQPATTYLGSIFKHPIKRSAQRNHPGNGKVD
ncbi:MAG: stage II sporulation protein R [Solirubrobacterales bacterium]